MSFRRQILRLGAVSLLVLLVGLMTGSAEAQRIRGPQRYTPARPTVSPYLNLLRANPSSVPNYYSFVRPLQRQQQFNTRQQSFLSQQNSTIRDLQEGVSRLETQGPASGTRSGFLVPGTRSTFLNTGGYFGTPIGNPMGGR